MMFFFQFAKTFFNLMSHIAKDQTLQYILTMLDDVLQVSDYYDTVKILKSRTRKLITVIVRKWISLVLIFSKAFEDAGGMTQTS